MSDHPLKESAPGLGRPRDRPPHLPQGGGRRRRGDRAQPQRRRRRAEHGQRSGASRAARRRTTSSSTAAARTSATSTPTPATTTRSPGASAPSTTACSATRATRRCSSRCSPPRSPAAPDATEWTIKLAANATFHDGATVDAEAVKYNFDRMLRKNLGVAWMFADDHGRELGPGRRPADAEGDAAQAVRAVRRGHCPGSSSPTRPSSRPTTAAATRARPG